MNEVNRLVHRLVELQIHLRGTQEMISKTISEVRAAQDAPKAITNPTPVEVDEQLARRQIMTERQKMTAVQTVEAAGGQVYRDDRFSTTPFPWVAMLPNETRIGFGTSDEEAATDAIAKAKNRKAKK